MATKLTDKALELLRGKNFAHLVTLNADGSPQVSPVWMDTDGVNVVINTAAGRLKLRNMQRDPRVALSILDAEDPYCYVEIRGRVVTISTEGGREGINNLSEKYTGNPMYQGPADETRYAIVIEPQHISGMG